MKQRKKIHIYLAVILAVCVPSFLFAELDTGKILQEFKSRQQELIFESDTFIEEGDAEILGNFRRLSIFNQLTQGAKEDRLRFEEQAEKINSRVESLEVSVEILEQDIKSLSQEIERIDGEIITSEENIVKIQQEIESLQEKIAINTEVLRDYLVYVYKKGNFVSDENDIDNLKTIILSGERIDEMLNDLYFKSIIQITGQQLVKNYQESISDLYSQQKNLEETEKTLRSLRRNGVIEKSLLDQKRAARQNLLSITKGQEVIYQRYVQEALEKERGLRIRELRQRIEINNTQRSLLERFNCEYVDIISDATLLTTLEPECQNVNKIIFAESRISGVSFANAVNPFDWPIKPYAGISAYFRDVGYKNRFGDEHDAIDIVAPQETKIRAAADGYVIFIEEPRTPEYAYLAIKHSDNLVTVYGHVSKIEVGLYDFVKRGDVIALSGGEFGTLGAGLLSTGPHLHFEVFEDQEYKDPLEYLDTSYLDYTTLPDRYRFKFISDFKAKKGYDFSQVGNEDAISSSNTRFRIVGNTEIERQKYLLNTYAVGEFRNWNIWVESALGGGIDPTFVMCVGLAETGLGKHMKSKNNVGNVGNNDRGDTRDFPTPRSAIVAMTSTFNNRFLGHYTEIQELSRYGNKTGSIYASSDFNWHNNITRCMSHVKGEFVPDDYKFRID